MMREDQAQAVREVIERGETQLLSAMLTAEPRLSGTPTPVTQDWGEEMWLPLHHAAAHGREDVVGLLLMAGASVDARTRFRTPMHGRETALMIATRFGQAGTVQRLLEHQADPGLLDATHRSALSHAAEHGHAEVSRQLIAQRTLIDLVDDQQRTPLHWAIRGGHTEIAMLLIDVGADVNHRCPKEPGGYTPLHRCVSVGEPMRGVLDRLLEAGADQQLTDPRSGRTAEALARELGVAWPSRSSRAAD